VRNLIKIRIALRLWNIHY